LEYDINNNAQEPNKHVKLEEENNGDAKNEKKFTFSEE